MSSKRRWMVVFLGLAAGCAGFSRGEYWDEDGTGGSGPDPTGAPTTTGGGGSAGSTSGDDGSGSDTAATSGGVVGLSYEIDVHDALDAGCERCHSPSGSAGGTGYIVFADNVPASYESALDFVNIDDPKASRLLSKMAGLGHGGGAIYDTRSPEYALTLQWIQQGALP